MTAATEQHLVTRAYELAERWYPPADLWVAERTDNSVTLLVEIEGAICSVRYVDLDASR